MFDYIKSFFTKVTSFTSGYEVIEKPMDDITEPDPPKENDEKKAPYLDAVLSGLQLSQKQKQQMRDYYRDKGTDTTQIQ